MYEYHNDYVVFSTVKAQAVVAKHLTAKLGILESWKICFTTGSTKQAANSLTLTYHASKETGVVDP